MPYTVTIIVLVAFTETGSGTGTATGHVHVIYKEVLQITRYPVLDFASIIFPDPHPTFS